MIELVDIRKSFGNLQVLKGIDLVIPGGKVTAVVGPSGAGKSTLLNIAGTLELPDSGIVRYDGRELVHIADHGVSNTREPVCMSDGQLSQFRNLNIGFVFQTHRLLPEFTLQENVAMPALIAGRSRRQSMAAAAELLGSIGLRDRLEHKPAQLSGGEAQRGAVARALINRPQVVLADEPSGSLDSENRRALHSLFFDICHSTGTTFVIVTHDEALAATADNVVRIADGRITSKPIINDD